MGNRMMKVIVFGSIAYGGFENIEQAYMFLRVNNYEPVNHVQSDGMDYRHINDFRNEKDLSKKITNHDLDWINKADCALVLADKPSWGSAMELYDAKQKGKYVIVFAANPLPTPWPISFADAVVTDKDQLLEALKAAEKVVNRNKELDNYIKKARVKL
jgi:hypothetical protein